MNSATTTSATAGSSGSASATAGSSSSAGATAGSSSSAGATAGSPSSAKRVHATHSTVAPTVLLAGPWQTGEFAAVRNAIDAQRELPTLMSLDVATSYIQTLDLPPDAVFLAQPRPGVDEQAAIDKLCQLAPLTRVVVIAGSWCEGELRTGKPLANVIRLYWYELPAWWRAACENVANCQCPMWSEPLVDVRSGSIVHLREGEAPAKPLGTLAIDAVDYAAFEALAAGLNSLGWNCTWRPRHRPHIGLQSSAASPSCSPDLRPGAARQQDQHCPGGESSPGKARGCKERPPTAAIWDGSQLDDRELDQLRNFCRKHAGIPVIALLDFPRAEHLATVKAAGAAAIIAKPYQLALLHRELHRLSTYAPAEKSTATVDSP